MKVLFRFRRSSPRRALKGYWRDQSLAQEFAALFRQFADRVALIDGERSFTYAELDRVTDNLALNLLEIGLRPLDRVVPTLPNGHEFVLFGIRTAEDWRDPDRCAGHAPVCRNQPVRAVVRGCRLRLPEQAGDFRFAPVMDRIQAENACMQIDIVLGTPQPGEHALRDLIDRPAPLVIQAGRHPHRPDRPVHLSAFGWYHRHPETDSAHPQRLCL